MTALRFLLVFALVASSIASLDTSVSALLNGHNETRCRYRYIPVVTVRWLGEVAGRLKSKPVVAPQCPLQKLAKPLAFSEVISNVEDIVRENRRVFVLYHVPYCPVSKLMYAVFETVATRHQQEAFVVVNAETDANVGTMFSSRTPHVPSVYMYSFPDVHKWKSMRRMWLSSGKDFDPNDHVTKTAVASLLSAFEAFVSEEAGEQRMAECTSQREATLGSWDSEVLPRVIPQHLTSQEPKSLLWVSVAFTVVAAIVKLSGVWQWDRQENPPLPNNE